MHWRMILFFTLILSMPASTRSWSTSFCAWTTLLLLPIFPDISLKLKKKVLAISFFHSKKEQQEKKKCCIVVDAEIQLAVTQGRLVRGAEEPLHLCAAFFILNSLMGSVQRLCDVKGHAALCWKCHKRHTLLHGHEWWEEERHHKTFCSGVVVFFALWAQHINTS